MNSEAGLFFGLYQTFGLNGFWIFVLTTLIMGGAAAVAAGRAVADRWGDVRMVVFYGLLLALAVRFIQYALYAQPLLSLSNYLIDAAFLIVAAAVGFRIRRSSQMTQQYPWLYERTSPVTWRASGTTD